MSNKPENMAKMLLDCMNTQFQKNMIDDGFCIGKVINLDKILDKMGMLNALSTMTGNIIGGMNNTIVANYNTLNEAIAGKYFNVSDWFSAKKEYYSLLPQMLGDLSKTNNKSKISQMIELYDAIQGEFRDSYGRNISGNAAKRGFTTKALFVVNNATEHEAQITGFIAMMRSTKIKDKSGKEISLYDAYEIKNGRLKVKDNVELSNEKRFDVMNKLHGMNKELHGNYNNFDKSVLQRYALGRLALMFRKYIYTGYQRRWATGYVDFEQGMYREGYYKVFLTKLIDDFRQAKYTTLFNWSNLTDLEKQSFRQTMLDVAIFFSVIGMFAILDDDDLKDNSALQNHTMLQLRRLQADIAFYGYFNSDVIRLMKTPAVTMDYMGRVIDWLDHVVLEWDEEDLYYQRKSGSHEKGDRKAYAKFEKIAMGLRGLAMFNTPEDQLTVFNNTTGAK